MAEPKASAVATQGKQSPARKSSLSVFDYKITFKEDGTLKWEPAANSKTLAIALSYHFPMEKDLESKMRAAIQKFIGEDVVASSPDTGIKTQLKDSNSEDIPHEYPQDGLEMFEISKTAAAQSVLPTASGGHNFTVMETPESLLPTSSSNSQSITPRSTPADGLTVLTWDPEAGAFKGSAKGMKRRHEKVEASKVAANRGNACEEHRRQKVKCDPILCPRNGQNSNFNLGSSTASKSSRESIVKSSSGPPADGVTESPRKIDISARSQSTKSRPQGPREISKATPTESHLKKPASTSSVQEREKFSTNHQAGKNPEHTLNPVVMPMFHTSSSLPTFNDGFTPPSEVDTNEPSPWWLQDEFGFDRQLLFNGENKSSDKEVVSATSLHTTPFINEFYESKPDREPFPSISKSSIQQFQEGTWTSHGSNYDWVTESPLATESSMLAWEDLLGDSGSPSFNSFIEHPLDGRSFSPVFNSEWDYNSAFSSGVTPETTFAIPEILDRDLAAPSGWETSGNKGLMPVGEGGLRQLMGMGPMDLDRDWEKVPSKDGTKKQALGIIKYGTKKIPKDNTKKADRVDDLSSLLYSMDLA